MATIDERVVSLKFNNGQFQKAVQTTLEGLSQLKTSMNFSGAKGAFDGLSSAAKSVNLQGLTDGIDKATSRFDNMKVVGLAALATLTAKATSAGVDMAKNLVNSAFIKAPKEGLAEYELKIGSIQTILANTSKHGTTLKQVTANLDELNKYSDKTIYNFGDMTRNIGLFTNAGIKIEDATSMIKGFSNEAASSGTTAANASGAAYQLSQALSAGKITLMDWKSLTNVGMGSANMKDGIIDIATAMGTFEGKSTSAKAAGEDFNGSLSEGWLTADVMQNYLKIQAGDLSDAQMKSIGLTGKQIEAFKKQAKVAQDAATKVRTLSQVFETYGEVVGSGWAESWEIVFGDFEEATALFTPISEALNGMAEASSDARNSILKGWADMGGRTALIEGVVNIFKALQAVIKPIKDAWADVFPPSGVNGLYIITEAFRNFTKLLIIGDGQATAIGATFKFFFNILKVGAQIIGGVFIVLGKLLEAIFTGGEGLDAMSAVVTRFFNNLNSAFENTEWITTFFTMLGDLIAKPIDLLQQFGGALITAFANSALVQNFGNAMSNVVETISAIGGAIGSGLSWILYGGLEAVFTRVIERIKSIGKFGEAVMDVFEKMGNVFRDIVTALAPVGEALAQMGRDIGENISNVFTDVNFDTGMDILNTGLLAGIVLLVRKFFKNILGMGEGAKEGLLSRADDLVGGLKEIMTGLTDTLSAMQMSLKADVLIKIATAIALLTASVVVLSLIDSDKLTKALLAISTMFIQLGVTMKVLTASMAGVDLGTMIGLGVALTLVAGAILILSIAVALMAQLSWNELAKGLTGVVVLLIALAKASQMMSKNAANLIATGIGLMAVAVAILILSTAVKTFANMDFGALMKGLIGVAGTLTALALFTKFAKTSKGALGSAAGLILLAVAVKILASAVGDFGDMDLGTLIQGFATLAAVLTALSAFSKGAGKVTNMVSMGAGLILLGVAMKIIASALADLGSIPLWELIKGLGAMAIALGSIAVALNLMPASTLASAASLVIVGVALKILAGALQQMGSMDIASIGKALLVLVVSLAAIAGAMLLMTGALPGAAALVVIAIALGMIVPTLILLGNIEWSVILSGLGALAAIFALFGLAGLLLAPVTPILLALGTAIAMLGVGMMSVGLGMLAFATGLGILATVGAAAIPVLVLLIMQLADLFPYLATKLGEAIVTLVEVLVANIPALVQGLTLVILALLQAVQALVPTLMDTILLIIEELIALLLNAIPALVDAGMKLIIGILDGIGSNIGQLVTAGYRVIINFLNGIAANIGGVIEAGVNVIVEFLNGVADNIGEVATAGADVIIALIDAIQKESNRIIDEGADAVINFINGVSDTIENRAGELKAAGERMAFAIADGMTGGLASKVKDVAAKARELADKAVNAAKNFLGINSPSKVFEEIGDWTGEGFIIGMDSRVDGVTKSATGMGSSALSAMKSSMSSLGKDLDGSMDVTPRITPVLDLTGVRKESKLISGLMSNQTIDPEASRNRANSIRNQQGVSSSRDLEVAKDGALREINFYQTNTSPKALSEVEIYRQTKNAMSIAKEEMRV